MAGLAILFIDRQQNPEKLNPWIFPTTLVSSTTGGYMVVQPHLADMARLFAQ